MDPSTIDARLRVHIEPGRAAQEKAYLKSDLVHLGVPVPKVRIVAKEVYEEVGLDRALIDALWATAVYEHRALATELLRFGQKALGRADLPWIEGMVRRARTWALIDTLAPDVIGPIVARDGAEDMDRWAQDDDFWVRRAALLYDLRRLRAGGGDWERFCRYADAMLGEKEFFIRKAIGWVLRTVAEQDPERVAAWIRPRLHRMSGLTRREATRKLPEGLRVALEAEAVAR